MNPVHDQYRKDKRLTPEYLKSRIASTEFEIKEMFGQKAMFCHFQLDNGYIVYGKKPSISIDPANFKEELGKQYSYQNTFEQLWELFAFGALETAREADQARDLIDWREHLEVVRQESFMSPESMERQAAVQFKFKKTGHSFAIRSFEGQDIQPQLVEAIKDHLGIEAIEPNRIVMIAKACHEANRAYCSSIGDDSQLAWHDAPEWQKASAINGVKFHLSGEHDPSESHQSWYDEKKADGWVYGPVKDAEKKEHPCMVAYDQLPVEQRSKDYIFRAIVHSFK